MFAICLTARRYIYSTRQFYCKFKFSEVQTAKILSVVNSSTVEDLTDRFGLSKARAKKLHFGRQQISKSVTSVDELLNIGGFSESVVNEFCKKILNEGDIDSDGMRTFNESASKPYKIVKDDVIRQIKSFTSIQLGLTGLAWCTFELTPHEMTKIIHWNWRPLPESKLNLHVMVDFVSSAVSDVPQSDFYLFENPIAASAGSSQKANFNAQVSNMIGMASVLLAPRSTLIACESINNVAFLKKYLYARLFKLYVGTEQISSPNYVDTMLRWSNTSAATATTNDDVRTLVRVDDDVKSTYDSSESHEKEFLSCTLLTGLAFLRLSILKCPRSHAELTKKSKKKVGENALNLF